MCPGLTSPGAVLTSVEKGTTVVSFQISVNFSYDPIICLIEASLLDSSTSELSL